MDIVDELGKIVIAKDGKEALEIIESNKGSRV